jgi:hypothetical protein
MKKIWMLIPLALVVLALYVGMAIKSSHPTEQLFNSMVAEMNKTHVVSFKSSFANIRYDSTQETIQEQWQFKRKGTYDAWSKFLNFENVTRFVDPVEGEDTEAEEKTSLSHEESGNMILLPIKEAYFKNGMYFQQPRASGLWEFQPKHSFDLIELLPLNAEVLNKYAKYYKSDNRGKFVVFFFSVDPNYLTRTFPDILEADGYDFPIRFKEATIKTLVFPDTNLPRRIYANYLIENLDTGDIYAYNIDTYFNIDEAYPVPDEPAIPLEILKHKE